VVSVTYVRDRARVSRNWWNIDKRATTAHTFDLAGHGFLVQAFRVPLRHDRQRRVHKDLDEGQVGCLVQLARGIAIGAERADKRGDGNHRGVCEQLGDLFTSTAH